MTTKTNSQTLEDPDDRKSIVVQEIRKLIVRLQHSEKYGVYIHGKVIDEINSFVLRNSLDCSSGNKTVQVCCYNCLRAHVMQKAREFELSPETVAYLGELFNGDIGHNGYYLDNKELLLIS